MYYIELGKYKIEVSVSNNKRMVNKKDIVELLDLEEKEIGNYYIDAKIITDTLFNKIYNKKTATKEQEIIFEGLCIVGLYSLIDEACEVDLRKISYIKEFKELINKK